jgi:uncharacterized protein YndB with AHSA1/START domain
VLVRQIVIPTTAEELWDALTEPDSVSQWFGSQVEWDLRPCGQARFLEDDGTLRRGVIESVRPGRHLRFRWWPEGEGPGVRRGTSEVSYDLEPDDEGTRLTVTEQPLPTPEPQPGVASASATVGAGTIAAAEPWTNWDSRMFCCWALLVASGAGQARAAAPAFAGRAVR